MSVYAEFIDFVEKRDGQLYAHCPFHRDDTPSFTVNEETNEWFCHSCKRGGAEAEFVAAYFDVDKQVARHALNHFIARGTWPFPSDEMIAQLQKNLRNSPNDLAALRSFGVSDEVIEKYKLGYESPRITIPVYGRTGYCVNIRKYLPPYKRDASGAHTAKCLNIRNLGAMRYFPYTAFDMGREDIYIVEGEKDCLVAISNGYNAVTSTGGSSIPTDELIMFKDKNVYLMLDSDAVGQKNVKAYSQLLSHIAKSIYVVNLPCKDYTEYFMETGSGDISKFVTLYKEVADEGVIATEMTLSKSEFTENMNTWVTLKGMSVVGVESKTYTVPSKIRVSCNNAKCTKMCPLAMGLGSPQLTEIAVEPRQIVQFIDAADAAQDMFLKRMFGCKSVTSEPLEQINVQKILFQESASFIDGLEDASSDSRYGLYMYTDYRLQSTGRYNFETCRVTDPRNQKNYYVIRSAEDINATVKVFDDSVFQKFRDVAAKSANAKEMMQTYYNEWMACLSIEGRLDMFGSMMLTFASITEIPWNYGIIKGWLDMMIVGDTRTGKSQMAQRLLKNLGMGGYINGENSKGTGVIGGVQKVGDTWMITWGAIPMNDKGALVIDEASGLDIEDVKNLSSMRSSGAVTLNKIIRGEARARTRLIWISNPRSGRNVDEFYWKGFDAFREYIPVVEDEARFDLVLTAAREDIEVLEGISATSMPDVERWKGLFSTAWNLTSDSIRFSAGFKAAMSATCKQLNTDYGGGPLVIGVSVHEKMLRMACAMAILCGNVYDGVLSVDENHIAWADEWLRFTLEKPSLAYGAYIREKRRAEERKKENVIFIRAQLEINPALRSLLTSVSFKGYQMQEVLGIDRSDASKILSELLRRGLVKTGKGSAYVPDKLLLDVAREEETF